MPSSKEEDFLNVLTIYGNGSHFGPATTVPWIHHFPPIHGDSIWTLASIGPVVSEVNMSENVDNDKRWTTEECLYNKLTYEPLAQVSLPGIASDIWLRYSDCADGTPLAVREKRDTQLIFVTWRRFGEDVFATDHMTGIHYRCTPDSPKRNQGAA